MAQNSSCSVGDRIFLRERGWRIVKRSDLSPEEAVLELEALDAEHPRRLSVVVPPDEFRLLPGEELSFDLQGLNAFSAWSCDHLLIAATLIQETSMLSGARFGRVSLEAYQLAPTMRLISKPRPSILIADDVGLGKTIEAGLALIELAARGRAERVLVVTPPGLLLQWRDELDEKFGLRFTLIENAAGLARVQGELPAGVNPWDALPRVLTSVDFIKKETVQNRALRKPWDLIIVDEAHGLAEAGTTSAPYRTQRTRLGLALRDNARGLILLSATPHNGFPHSFRSLLDLVAPASASLRGSREAVARRVQSAMVRRMKPQIVRSRPDGSEEPMFPVRVVEGVPVSLEPAERELLSKVASYCSRTARFAEGTDNAELVSFAMQIVKKRALSSRAALKKTIEHRLDALRKGGEEEVALTRAEVRELRADLPLDEAASERTAMRIVKSALPADEKRRDAEVRALNGIRKVLRGLPERDPKIETLLDRIRAVFAEDAAAKVIVFTEYLDTLEAIQGVLEGSSDLAGRFVILRGGLSGRRRLKVQERFEAPQTRILLATDAASEGLNLQRSCHRVFHFELPWNPNRMEQRNGRVDRYGQTMTPQIRYLYYPDSPEDDVLHRLVEKIGRMQDDRVSTPDILGVLQGEDGIGQGLVRLDPSASDVETHKRALVRLFDDRTADFVRNLSPLVSAGDGDKAEHERLDTLLGAAHPLLPDDEGLEKLVSALLGPACFKAAGREHVYRIEVPARFRGPGVLAAYPRATFRRSVAVRERAAEVDFITPLHPFMQSMAAVSRLRLLQVYPDQPGLPPRRLAARRVPASEPVSAVFTFLGQAAGGGGLREETMIAVRLAPDCRVIGTPEEALRWLNADGAAGEVSAGTLERLFQSSFVAMAGAAIEAAGARLLGRTAELRERRCSQAEVLRCDLEIDLADRLSEIEDEERRANGLEEESGQLRLISLEEARPAGFEARRAAAKAQAEKRRDEIAAFERVKRPGGPRPLGALFLVPEGQS